MANMKSELQITDKSQQLTRKAFLVIGAWALFGVWCLVFGACLPGCATTEGVSNIEIARLENRLQVVETELKQAQEENLALKEKISGLQKTAPLPRMPNGTEIQNALKNAGFYRGKIDGQIGTQTKEAIKKFQEANKLNADGVMGSRTWELLSKYLEPKIN